MLRVPTFTGAGVWHAIEEVATSSGKIMLKLACHISIFKKKMLVTKSIFKLFQTFSQ